MGTNDFGLKLYNIVGNWVSAIFGSEKAKYFFEAAYWRGRWILEGGKLKNSHYQNVYTKAFNLQFSDFENAKILDLGCGPRGSLEWAQLAKERIGLDPLAHFYQKLNGQSHQMQYLTAKAESLPFPNEYFDIVSSFNSLDHVDDLKEVLSEIKRVLKPGGLFLLITDIHPHPALCEPTVINWDIHEQLRPELHCEMRREIKRQKHIYESIHANLAYEGAEYGIYMGKFLRV